MNLIFNPVYSKPGAADDAEQDIEAARKGPDFQGGGSGMGAPYHVRVLIPCYKEPFEIVQRTISAIRDAVLPAGETRAACMREACQGALEKGLLLCFLIASERFA